MARRRLGGRQSGRGRLGHGDLDQEQDLPDLHLQGVGRKPGRRFGRDADHRLGPAAGTIRSWMFDSDGGFGEGTWSKHGDTWVVKFNQVLADGRKASATNVYKMVDGNTFTWKSIGRKLDGQFLDNIDEVKMVRKAAAWRQGGREERAKGAAKN